MYVSEIRKKYLKNFICFSVLMCPRRNKDQIRKGCFSFCRSFKAGSPGRASGFMFCPPPPAPKPGKKALGMRLVLSAFLGAYISTEYLTVLAFAVCC